MGIRLLATGALLLAFAPAAQCRSDRLGYWSAATEHIPAYPAETKAVVLLHETIFTVQVDGKAEEHVREVIKILRPQGRPYGQAGVRSTPTKS